jgi:hypothetical protein
MRDLKADLEWLREPSMQDGECIDDPDILGEYIRECNEIATIAEHALERAIEAEALARELVEALRRYEEWEASLLLEDGVWERNAGLPVFTQELYDSWMEIQDVRNEALIKAKEVLGDV